MSTELDSSASGGTAATPSRRMPGIEGFWVFVAGDLTIFTLLFFSFLDARRDDVAGFETARASLDLTQGGINTLILHTSSWCVVEALGAARRGAPIAARWLVGGLIGGLAFIVSKAIEYTEGSRHGHTPSTSDFYTYYYALTGLHLAHVVAGCVMLTVMLVGWRRKGASVRPATESAACYWHLVDLLWIVIFPLLYLAR